MKVKTHHYMTQSQKTDKIILLYVLVSRFCRWETGRHKIL